jgi:Uma2 family endonuclease
MSLAHATPRMTFDEFIVWSAAQARGRYELVNGEVVEMPSEGGRHNLVKLAAAQALQDAVRKAKFAGTVFTDGMTVRIDEWHGREPDAAVTVTPVADLEALYLIDPLIVVEVVSPTSERDDTGVKLLEYFTVPSIRHYLIVRPREKAIVHHSRGEDGEIRTSILYDGELQLDPPGLTVTVDPILAAG